MARPRHCGAVADESLHCSSMVRTASSASLSTASAKESLLGKWKCRAPVLTPARLLIAGREASAYPSSAKISAAALMRARRVRAARSCLTMSSSSFRPERHAGSPLRSPRTAVPRSEHPSKPHIWLVSRGSCCCRPPRGGQAPSAKEEVTARERGRPATSGRRAAAPVPAVVDSLTMQTTARIQHGSSAGERNGDGPYLCRQTSDRRTDHGDTCCSCYASADVSGVPSGCWNSARTRVPRSGAVSSFISAAGVAMAGSTRLYSTETRWLRSPHRPRPPTRAVYRPTHRRKPARSPPGRRAGALRPVPSPR